MMTKANLKIKKCNKTKWQSEEAFQIPKERREAKSEGEKERNTLLNEEIQRIARRDKKALSEQCKERQENNRMEKTRDFFKKIRDTKGTFHEKNGHNKQLKKKKYGPNRSH